MNNKKVIKILGVSILIVIIIIAVIITNLSKITKDKNDNLNNENNLQENTIVEMTEEEKKENEKIIKKLKNSSEAERVQTYIGTYFKYIEKKDYSSAYELLYPKFRENYFLTLEDFEKYIIELNFPEMLLIDYDDVYTQGEYYIVTVKIGNFLNRADLEQEKTLILQENGYNDYYISLKM